MRVLGIDCGAERTGYGVIESNGRDHRMVASGVIRTAADRPLAERLLEISNGLRGVIREHAPVEVAVEDVFVSLNAKSALKLAHVRGVAMLAAAEAGLACGEYSPAEVKISVAGSGQARKSQVQWMVRSILGNGVPVESADACDALAVAICHVTRRGRGK